MQTWFLRLAAWFLELLAKIFRKKADEVDKPPEPQKDDEEWKPTPVRPGIDDGP